jgi:hypothetical protein
MPTQQFRLALSRVVSAPAPIIAKLATTNRTLRALRRQLAIKHNLRLKLLAKRALVASVSAALRASSCTSRGVSALA